MPRRVKCDVYPVGLLADLQQCYSKIRYGETPVSAALPALAAQFVRGFRRGSYWNGYLAEAANIGRCGQGWTRRRALRRLDELARSRVWVRHQQCGTTRLSSTIVKSEYCVTCKTESSRQQWETVWRPLPHLEYEPVRRWAA